MAENDIKHFLKSIQIQYLLYLEDLKNLLPLLYFPIISTRKIFMPTLLFLMKMGRLLDMMKITRFLVREEK